MGLQSLELQAVVKLTRGDQISCGEWSAVAAISLVNGQLLRPSAIITTNLYGQLLRPVVCIASSVVVLFNCVTLVTVQKNIVAVLGCNRFWRPEQPKLSA